MSSFRLMPAGLLQLVRNGNSNAVAASISAKTDRENETLRDIEDNLPARVANQAASWRERQMAAARGRHPASQPAIETSSPVAV